MNRSSAYALLTAAMLLAYGCTEPDIRQQANKLLGQVSKIQLVEAAQGPRYALVQPVAGKGAEGGYQVMKLTSAPVDRNSSYIIVTEDTIGLSPVPGDIDCQTDDSNIIVLVEVGLQEGEYYCQEWKDGRFTRVIGPIGDIAGLIARTTNPPSFPANAHAVAADNRTQVCVYQRNDLAATPTCYSSDGKKVYVYLQNGTYYVIAASENDS